MNQNTDLNRRLADLEQRLEFPKRSTTSLLGKGLVLLTIIVSLSLNTVFVFDYMGRKKMRNEAESFWVLCQAGSTAAQRKQAFQHLIRAGNQEWRSARLAELDLKGADFDGVLLRAAKLDRVNFRGASLSRAKMVRTSLHLVDFTDATLTAADLTEADFLRGIAKNANLEGAVIRAGRMEQSVLHEAILNFANLEDANLLMADFTGASLVGTNLKATNLESTIFDHADLNEADFERARIVEATFVNSNWWRARGFSLVDLERLQKDYAPNDTASDELIEDYQKWVAEFTKSIEQAGPKGRRGAKEELQTPSDK